jgi:beta-glucosidase
MKLTEGPSRRGLAVGASAAALAACAPKALVEPAPQSSQFPKNFLWGAATSAFQIEGALKEDGRGPSIWDGFPKASGRIVDGSDASVATDSSHRWQEDVGLLAAGGMNAYRFSVAWPRIQASGAGPANDKGLDYYSRLVDALLAKNIQPYATLFHWDLPQALQDKGGWLNRDTTARFADYAAIVGQRLGDRLKHFITLNEAAVITLNEAAVHTFAGHVLGEHAPGLSDAGNIGPVTHHQNLAQGLAIQALRAGRPDLEIGATLALMPVRPEAGLMLGPNRLAADGFDALWNKAYLDPLLKGTYPDLLHASLDKVLKAGDLAITRQPVAFVGVNYYAPAFMKFVLDNPAHVALGDPPKGVKLDAFGREIDPMGLTENLDRLRTEYGNPPVIITENGCSDPFSSGSAILDDGFRVDFLRQHLKAVRVAMERGAKVRGYFVWTLVDNWEWDKGFTSKFGLCAMDRKTGVRTPKRSMAWFKALAQSGALDRG